MIRVLLFIIGVAALAFGAVWLADRPGDIAITWLGHRVETSVMVGAAALALLIAATILVWSTLRGIMRAPAAFSSFRARNRATRGYRAVSRGIVAIGAGDAPAARRFANEARRLLPNEPLALLLGAQTAQLTGDSAQAERTFRTMAERNDTKLLGLHGLFIEAQRRDDPAAARACAEEAARVEPALPWAGEAVLQHRCADGDWVGALAALDSNMRNGLVAKDVFKRQRAVLLTGRALSGQVDRETATGLVLQALKLSPGLVPAAALAGRLLAEAGRSRKAGRVIEQAWAINPHPDLAEVYATIRPRLSSRERLNRIRNLARLSPNHPETALAVARAALDAQEFAAARESLAPLLANPSQRVAALMAELEEKQSGDVGRAREWMARALNASRDPAWTADGLVSNSWMPISPVSGRLDAFEWRIPLADLGPKGPVIEHGAPSPPQGEPLPPPPAAAPPAHAPAPAAEAAAPPAPPAPPVPAEAPTAAAPPAALTPSAQQAAGVQHDVAPKPDGGAAPEPVVPLVHAPDDPGPEPDRANDPEAAAPEEKRRVPWYMR